MHRTVQGAALVLLLAGSLTTPAGTWPSDFSFLPIEGDHRILVLRVAYPDLGPEQVFPLANAELYAQQLEQSIEINSYGKAQVTIDIAPLLPLPRTSDEYTAGPTLVRLRADALALAAANGIFGECYDREIILSQPKLWAGAPALGGQNYRTSWISGGANPSGWLWAHEIGHTYGWRHANLWDVPAGLPPTSEQGESIEYGDKFDTMGDFAGFHHFNPWFKHRANWLLDSSIQTVTLSGTYAFRPLEATPGSSIPSALRIGTKPGRDTWIFYRSQEPLGAAGPVLTWGHRSNARASLLLDMTPGSMEDDWKDAELVVGETFTDPDAGFDVTVLAITDNGVVVVDVAFHGGSPGTIDELPVVDVVQPARGEVVTGPVTYEVEAFDPDAGTANGAGIDRVDFVVFAGDSDANAIATGSDSTPPYTLDLDPASVPDFVDNAYALSITAVSLDGGVNQYTFAHLIDLTGPHPGIPPPAGEAGRPPEVPGLALSGGQPTTLQWLPAMFADEYDVSRGRLADLDGLDYGECRNDHDPDLTDTSFLETELPATAGGFFYLVRGRNLTCPAAGTYGHRSQGGQRINRNPAACP